MTYSYVLPVGCNAKLILLPEVNIVLKAHRLVSYEYTILRVASHVGIAAVYASFMCAQSCSQRIFARDIHATRAAMTLCISGRGTSRAHMHSNLIMLYMLQVT